MQDDGPFFVGMFAGALLSFVITTVVVIGCNGWHWQTECVKRGAATWVVDESGRSTFTWKGEE